MIFSILLLILILIEKEFLVGCLSFGWKVIIRLLTREKIDFVARMCNCFVDGMLKSVVNIVHIYI